MSMNPSFFLVAGEASADLHAAALVHELKKHYPQMHLYGVGGKALQAEGMEVVVPSESLNVVGITDWLDRVGEVLSAYRKVLKVVQERKPDCAVLLDLPDFNFKLARKLKKLGIPVVYYISPQIWAWRRYRIKKVKKYVDRMLVLFPFEKTFYEQHGIETIFVGHPLLEKIQARKAYRPSHDVKSSPRIALLPGSRKSELRYHAPILALLIKKIKKNYPNVEFKLPVASILNMASVKEMFPDEGVSLTHEKAPSVVEWADIAVVASGTATLETALVGTPFCLFYKISGPSSWVFKFLIRYRSFLGMPNLLHGREVVKEFFQEKATVEDLYLECQKMIEDDFYRSDMVKHLLGCRERLGTSGASTRAAHEVQNTLSKKRRAFGGTLESAFTVS